MKQLIPAMIGIGVFMVIVVGVILFNLPDDNLEESYNIAIDASIFDGETLDMTDSEGGVVGQVQEITLTGGNTVLDFTNIEVDGDEAILSSERDDVSDGVFFEIEEGQEFIVDVTSEQLEEYQFIHIYDSESEEILATATI